MKIKKKTLPRVETKEVLEYESALRKGMFNKEIKKELHEKLADIEYQRWADWVDRYWYLIEEELKQAYEKGKEEYKDICLKCRGKGYSTSMQGTHYHADFIADKEFKTPQEIRMRFCDCGRGKQLEDILRKYK